MNIIKAMGLWRGPKGDPGPPGPRGPAGLTGITSPPAMCEFCYLQEAYFRLIDKPICKNCSKKVYERIELILKFQ